MAHHRKSEAIDILCKIRGDKDASDPEIVRELELINAVVERKAWRRTEDILLGSYAETTYQRADAAILADAIRDVVAIRGAVDVVRPAGGEGKRRGPCAICRARLEIGRASCRERV